jgi:transcription initiation factor TFIIIB Brf1 subunit/transcription initiation factor TFIIB
MPEQNVNKINPLADEKEYGQHARAIQKLAQELGVPVEEVNRSYREILDVLKKDAKVRAFLPILVSRSVKERLRQR